MKGFLFNDINNKQYAEIYNEIEKLDINISTMPIKGDTECFSLACFLENEDFSINLFPSFKVKRIIVDPEDELYLSSIFLLIITCFNHGIQMQTDNFVKQCFKVIDEVYQDYVEKFNNTYDIIDFYKNYDFNYLLSTRILEKIQDERFIQTYINTDEILYDLYNNLGDIFEEYVIRICIDLFNKYNIYTYPLNEIHKILLLDGYYIEYSENLFNRLIQNSITVLNN